jgi:hypothetical protein
MEVLAVAASVAGIPSLVGKSIEGIIKLERIESVTMLQWDMDSF